MANELLSMAFETINLSNMAWMVSSGVNNLPDEKKELGEFIDKVVASFPENLDFVDNVVRFQPLGLPIRSKTYKSSLDKEALVKLAKALKSTASEKNSKDFFIKVNKILKTLEITNSYLKDREFFENRSATLNSANPYGRFMG